MNTEVPSFYSRPGLHVQIYDELTAREWDTPQNDISFYLEEARAGGGPILELGCGTGRLVIPLLSTGFDVHGLDANTAMLAVARQKRQQLPAEVAKQLRLHHGDMREFELGQQFAFIFIAFRSFQNLLTPETQRQSLIFRYEMRHLVESCGFGVESEYSNFQRSPPQYGKEQIWVLRRT